MSSPRNLPLRVGVACWAIMMLALIVYSKYRQHLGGDRFVALACVVGWLLGCEVIVASGGLLQKITDRVNRTMGAALITVPLLTYFVYAIGTRSFDWGRVGIAVAFCLLPTFVAASAGEKQFGSWQDYVALFLIFFPYWRGILRQLWIYPDPAVRYTFSCMLAIQVGLVVFFLVRRADRTGYGYAWARGWTLVTVVCYLLAGVIIIPLSMKIHFVAFDPHRAHLSRLPLDMLGIFLFTAWGEEFFFRGLLQNALQRTLRNEYVGWALASIIFGFSHILHGHAPNWKYVFLASIAGVIYGFAWRKTGSMTVSATIHMAVDVTWHQLFRTL